MKNLLKPFYFETLKPKKIWPTIKYKQICTFYKDQEDDAHNDVGLYLS